VNAERARRRGRAAGRRRVHTRRRAVAGVRSGRFSTRPRVVLVDGANPVSGRRPRGACASGGALRSS
jgi:hypothetical protein